MEGAAAFATFVPRRRRAALVRAAVAFQSTYNYLDLLAEQPHARAVRNAGTLHAALPAALTSSPPISGGHAREWYAHLDGRDDSSYLQAMVDAARQAVTVLPSHAAVQDTALAAAARVAAFQRWNCGERQGDQRALRRWALAKAPAAGGVAWWELAASAGSSLGVYVALAAAATPRVQGDELAALERLTSRGSVRFIRCSTSSLTWRRTSAPDSTTSRSATPPRSMRPGASAGWQTKRSAARARCPGARLCANA